MTDRFLYPGQGAGESTLSGALTPGVTVGTIVSGIQSLSGSPVAGPRFGRTISRGKDVYSLEWASVTHPEAAFLVRQWTDAANGMRSLWYVPDDGTAPTRVLISGPPAVSYTSASMATVSVVLEEQR